VTHCLIQRGDFAVNFHHQRPKSSFEKWPAEGEGGASDPESGCVELDVVRSARLQKESGALKYIDRSKNRISRMNKKLSWKNIGIGTKIKRTNGAGRVSCGNCEKPLGVRMIYQVQGQQHAGISWNNKRITKV
jgi:hypothetical protein